MIHSPAGYELKRLPATDAQLLQNLYDRCSEFVSLVQGHPPTGREGVDLMQAVPEGPPTDNKFVFGIYRDEEMVGAIDVLRDYPTPAVWYLGLLLVAPDERGRGLGALILEALRQWIAAEAGDAIRLVVQSQNLGALRFWTREGFVEIDPPPSSRPAHEVHHMTLRF